MTSRTSGDAEWMAAPVTVKPSLEVLYTNAAGKQTFTWLADAAAAGTWRRLSVEFTHADAVKASVYHVPARKGSEVSTTAEDPTYALTPADLEAELKLIQSKAIAVRTVDQALDEVVPQLG